jgi:hypothetical protein
MKPCATPSMYVPRWLRVCAAGMIAASLAVGAAAHPAPSTGTGSGYCSVDGQKFNVKYVYAHQRTRTYTAMGKQVNETAVTIWLTDQPLDNAALDKETADHFRAVSRQMMQAFVKGTPPVRYIRIELTPAGKVVNFDCAPKGEGTIGTADIGRFESKAVSPTRTAGRFTTGGSITVASSKFDVDVQFDAPVAAEK